MAITAYFSIICYWFPRVNRRARPGLVTITHGYRYLGNVQNRWLSTGGGVRIEILNAQNFCIPTGKSKYNYPSMQVVDFHMLFLTNSTHYTKMCTICHKYD